MFLYVLYVLYSFKLDFFCILLFQSFSLLFTHASIRVYATAIMSVCLSVTSVLCIKTAERIIEILSLSDRPIIFVFVSPRVVA